MELTLEELKQLTIYQAMSYHLMFNGELIDYFPVTWYLNLCFNWREWIKN